MGSLSTGALSHTTPTSVEEFRRHKDLKRHNSSKPTPLKDIKHCPICNKAQDIRNSNCIKCNYKFNTAGIGAVINTSNEKPKISLFDSDFSDDELFNIMKMEFNHEDHVKWDMECIPRGYSSKLNRFFNDFDNICFSRLKINENESIYYFADKKERFPKLMLFFNNKTLKSNFKIHDDEVLVLLKINNNLKEILKNFKVIYATKNKKSKLFYVSVGNLKEDNFVDNILFLISEFGDSLSNPLLNNYEYYEEINLEEFL